MISSDSKWRPVEYRIVLSNDHSLQTSELVDEVTCIVDANHSLLPCIVFVYQKEVYLIFNYKKIGS